MTPGRGRSRSTSPPPARSRSTSSRGVTRTDDVTPTGVPPCDAWRADWEQPEDAASDDRRARALAAAVGRAEPGRARRRALLEGVRQPDRAREDAADAETLEWLAERLDTDASFLEHGVSRADARTHRRRDPRRRRPACRRALRPMYEEASAAVRELSGPHLAAGGAPLLRGDAWARIRTGRARGRVGAARGGGVARSRSRLHRRRSRGCRLPGRGVRYSESRIGEAIALLDEALVLAESSALPDDRILRSDIFHWRARCHRRHRDWAPPRRHRACPRARRGLG